MPSSPAPTRESVAKSRGDWLARGSRSAGVAINYDLPPSQQPITDIRSTYEVNVFGAIRVTQAFLPLLLAADAARIVMVSSYSASLGRALDLAPRGVLVNAGVVPW